MLLTRSRVQVHISTGMLAQIVTGLCRLTILTVKAVECFGIVGSRVDHVIMSALYFPINEDVGL